MKRFFCFLGSTLFAFVMLLGCVPGNSINNSSIMVSHYAANDVQTYGGSLLNIEYRTINYTDKLEKSYTNPYKAPTFIASLANACAVEAGGNAIIYYDRIYDELIPDYKHKYIFGKFTYGTHNDAITNMFKSLYNLMETDTIGTTINGFKKGLNDYVRSKNRMLELNKATGNYYNTDFEYIKGQLEQEKMAVIFLDTYSITSFGGFQTNENYDYISHYIFEGLHTMLIYGYKDIFYYDAAGNIITRDTYFYVSTGFDGASLALINIRDFCKVDDIYIINIK